MSITDELVLLARINELSDVQIYIMEKKIKLEKELEELKKNRKEDLWVEENDSIDYLKRNS